MPELTDFTPVPRQRNRRDGWTPARQRAFIAALAGGARVRAAANGVGMTPEGAYHLRRQPGAESFAAAWQAAQAEAEAAVPPPVLPPLTMQGVMMILRAQAERRRREQPSRVITARVRDVRHRRPRPMRT